MLPQAILRSGRLAAASGSALLRFASGLASGLRFCASQPAAVGLALSSRPRFAPRGRLGLALLRPAAASGLRFCASQPAASGLRFCASQPAAVGFALLRFAAGRGCGHAMDNEEESEAAGIHSRAAVGE